MDSIISIERLTKSFGSVQALRGVDLDLRRGEVLALLGDNGAGKSTLIKILSGLEPPTSGSLIIDGLPVDWRSYSVKEARLRGVETVYQERSLGERQPLWRNVFVGRHLRNRLGFIDARREKTVTMRILSDVLGLRGVGLRPEAPVSVLSGGERQGLAIARAMHFDAAVVVLDEPTTALAIGEVEKVLRFVDSLRRSGRSCLLISHELPLVWRIADRFAIMESGRIVATLDRSVVTEEDLIARLLAERRGR